MPKARILAVDDQRYFRELIEGLLVEEGYEVQTASSGEEALHVLEREDFDVIVTDLVMPGIDGSELVDRIKQRQPEQEVIMVTGVVDVKTAVDAMKQGITDYILKPFDRKALSGSLDRILQRRRLRDEHARLMVENLEYMGVLSLYERAAGLFRTLALEPLAERIIEGLCLETRAQGGVLWIAEDMGEDRLKLVGARGLIRVEEEPEELCIDDLDDDFEALVEHGRSLIRPRIDGRESNTALFVPLRHSGELLGIARLSDKLEGGDFGDAQRAAAEKFVSLGSVALTNALRFRALERRSFRDPVTKAYTYAYFQDVVRNEIQKANRFDHHFSILRIDLGSLVELRRSCSENQLGRYLEDIAFHASTALRSTDLIATESEGRYCVLLPETDSVGAAILGRRVREAIERSGVLQTIDVEHRPELNLASASYPADGTQLDSLERVLDQRIHEECVSLLRLLALEQQPFHSAVDKLLCEGKPERDQVPEEVTRFMLGEVARRPREHGLLFLSPGNRLGDALSDGLQRVAGIDTRTEIIVVADRPSGPPGAEPVTWVSPQRAGTDRAFLLYYGDGPAYAMVTDAPADGGGGADFFHTGDRALVEHLVFQLQRDLDIPQSV